MGNHDGLIVQHGGYRKLKSFQIAQLVYDVTVRFCERYIDKFSRTVDQMTQAARSGVQNIAEGSQASGTSKKTEIKLTNVARSSLEELRRDYEDFLRQCHLRQWDMHDPRRKELIARRPKTADDVSGWVQAVYERENRPSSMTSTASIPSTYPEIAANTALTLIAVANSLLDRQIKAQAEAFEREGGFTERMYRTRQQNRRKQ